MRKARSGIIARENEMLTTLTPQVTTIFTLVTTDMRGTIIDIELFDKEPTFPLTRHHSLYVGDINGGDTRRLFPALKAV
jgi:hypothetical protein